MKTLRALSPGLILVLLGGPTTGRAADAPQWMRDLVGTSLPAYDDETSAVLLYSETVLTVQAPGKMKRSTRTAYKILRREGESFAYVRAYFDMQSPITAMRGWSIPVTGKHYEIKSKDIVEAGAPAVEGGELVLDIRSKLMRIPAAEPGSIIGYELEQEQRPYDMTDEWEFQETVPVRNARYTVAAPAGWSYKTFWLNHAEMPPTTSAAGQWTWSVNDVKPVKLEANMPPWRGIAGKLVLSLQPAADGQGGFRSWQEVGAWYSGLTQNRREPSQQIKQKVQELTASGATPLSKMKALAAFVQKDVRYVAIELGIGGLQPHRAAEVFDRRYGDCKDKVTLLSAMLKEIGLTSHYVLINTRRGSVDAATPPNLGFNHAILAIELPAATDAAALHAVHEQPKLGRVLFFDPTSELVPLGDLPGMLQANYGLLVAPDGGVLVRLPQSPTETNGVQRTANLELDEGGTLRGEVVERWVGDGAATRRYELRAASASADQIKPVESMLSHSFSNFQITRAAVRNLQLNDRPFEWTYALDVGHYAKAAGDLLLVRPRVLGSYSRGFLETRKPRTHAIEFEAPEQNTDVFEITLPAGYEVEDLPPPVERDFGFVRYKSATQLAGRVLRYTRTFEIREVSVPAAKAPELKELYRTIENDERMSAVLKRKM